MTPFLLSHLHPTHMQILPTEPLESLSSLSLLASSTHITLVLTTVFAHLDKGKHLLTHLLASLLVLRQSIPTQKPNDPPFEKAMSSCHSRLSTPNGALSHSQCCPITLRTRSRIFITGYENLLHLVLDPYDLVVHCSSVSLLHPSP